ncbi:Gigantea protein [Corchorus olitorius]|uniref:Gigantea protein n=1 Tax=Corchorus olitorius TaxID=93759 RepID=A0A1R3JUU5_9ROSI|nr:Gigantea protein [Corchorus olitorius]
MLASMVYNAMPKAQVVTGLFLARCCQSYRIRFCHFYSARDNHWICIWVYFKFGSAGVQFIVFHVNPYQAGYFGVGFAFAISTSCLVQITAYVEYFGQFTSEQFPEDIAELIRNRYPSKEQRLFDDVLAMFVLHHPEHGHAVVLPIISCIIDGTLVYDKTTPPFASFISLVCPSSENEYSEQWALACGEILRILTHYNRPIYKVEPQNSEIDRSSSSSQATTSESVDGAPSFNIPLMQQERKPLRPLSPWITDILLAAPLGIRSDYFRW